MIIHHPSRSITIRLALRLSGCVGLGSPISLPSSLLLRHVFGSKPMDLSTCARLFPFPFSPDSGPRLVLLLIVFVGSFVHQHLPLAPPLSILSSVPPDNGEDEISHTIDYVRKGIHAW